MPYNIPLPSHEFEKRVQEAGYPWIQTVKLHPRGTKDSKGHPFPIYDGLRSHVHQNENTHLIVTGQLTIKTSDGYQNTIDAHDDHEDKEFYVEGGTRYRGWAGRDGAVFVEGHKILSPGTADRYERHGSIYWWDDDTGLSRKQWLEEQELAALTEVEETNAIDVDNLYD